MTRYQEWVEGQKGVDTEEAHKIAMSGKDFEFEIPELVADLVTGLMLDRASIVSVITDFLTLVEVVYWKGYQRGKKERSLIFVVAENEA